MTAIFLVHAVANMPGITLNGGVCLRTEIDSSHIFSGLSVNHSEVISRNSMRPVKSKVCEHNSEFAILQQSGFNV